MLIKIGSPNAAGRTYKERNAMTKSSKPVRPTRRNFLKVAAAASAVAAPNVVSAQGVINMRWQSTWPSKDIFHEYAQDYAKKVNDMSGGDLKIDVLPAGAVVPPFGLLDAGSKGTLDGGHGLLVYHHRKQKAPGVLGAAEFNNASSDRALGFADVSKVCMLQSYHQNAEQFEITFNKTKYDALPDKLKAIIANAVDAASADMSQKAIDRYSQDYVELQSKDNVKFYKTADAVLQKQLELYDEIVAKKAADNPLFKEIVQSQLAFARRTTRWEQDTVVSRKMAFDHYFGPNAKPVKI